MDDFYVITPADQKVLDRLRQNGYAVCVFNSEEVGDANPRRIEDRMCEEGWNAIFCLSTEEEFDK